MQMFKNNISTSASHDLPYIITTLLIIVDAALSRNHRYQTLNEEENKGKYKPKLLHSQNNKVCNSFYRVWLVQLMCVHDICVSITSELEQTQGLHAV